MTIDRKLLIIHFLMKIQLHIFNILELNFINIKGAGMKTCFYF